MQFPTKISSLSTISNGQRLTVCSLHRSTQGTDTHVVLPNKSITSNSFPNLRFWSMSVKYWRQKRDKTQLQQVPFTWWRQQLAPQLPLSWQLNCVLLRNPKSLYLQPEIHLKECTWLCNTKFSNTAASIQLYSTQNTLAPMSQHKQSASEGLVAWSSSSWRQPAQRTIGEFYS